MKNKNLAGGLFAGGKPAPLVTKESALSMQIKDYLDSRRLWNERLNCGRVRTDGGHLVRLCAAGTPDRLIVVRGQAVFIETKTSGAKPTLVQLEKHLELAEAGAIVIVADDFNKFRREFAAVRARIEENRRGAMNLYD